MLTTKKNKPHVLERYELIEKCKYKIPNFQKRKFGNDVTHRKSFLQLIEICRDSPAQRDDALSVTAFEQSMIPHLSHASKLLSEGLIFCREF